MDNQTLGVLLTDSLKKLGFINYGQRLFYKEFNECIVVLKQITYNMAAELYLEVIIKQCHPEIDKITKTVITDKMVRDTYSDNRLWYRTSKGFGFDLYEIPEESFAEKITELYNIYIGSFQRGVIEGVTNYNQYLIENQRQFLMDLFIDSAEKIGHPELAGEKDHDWFLSDRYILLYEYGVDDRFVNENTGRYIMENVIANIPNELKGKARTKWCNDRCKEIFLMKGKRISLGWGILFPIVNGKPLKYCGCNVNKPKQYQIYYNEDTGETFHYIRVRDENAPNGHRHKIEKVNKDKQ